MMKLPVYFFLYFLAVLAAGAPEHAAFMADESMQALPGLQPLQYTVGFYLQYMDKIKPILKILQKGIQYINLTKGLRFQVIKVVFKKFLELHIYQYHEIHVVKIHQ